VTLSLLEKINAGTDLNMCWYSRFLSTLASILSRWSGGLQSIDVKNRHSLLSFFRPLMYMPRWFITAKVGLYASFSASLSSVETPRGGERYERVSKHVDFDSAR
jgi:hypothetical protein